MHALPRLILFDLDDTLCDYRRARDLRLRIAFSQDQRPSGTEPERPRDIERMIADSLALQPHGADHFPEVFQRHGITDAAVVEAAITWFRSNRLHGLELFADAATTIAALREAAAPEPLTIGVVTNGPAGIQRDKIELLAVSSLVDFTLVSGEFGHWKPDRRIFEEALRLGGASAEEALFVGDSIEHDMVGAREAGIRTIWVNRHDDSWPATLPRPDFEIATVGDLVQLLAAR